MNFSGILFHLSICHIYFFLMNQVGGNFWKYSNQFQKFNSKTWLEYVEDSLQN